jgi:hypothetical protein
LWCQGSQSGLLEASLGGDATGLDRREELAIVALVLLGTTVGELDDRAVEGDALAEVGGDRSAVVAAGVRTSERPAA